MLTNNENKPLLKSPIKKEDITLYPNGEDKNPELWTDLGDRRRMSLDTFKNQKYRFYVDGDRLKAINPQGDFIANNIAYSPELRNHLEKHPELIIGQDELQTLKRNTDKARRPYKYEQGAQPIAGPLEYAILGGKSLANGALKSTWNLVKPLAEKAVTDFSNKTNLSYWANNKTGKLGQVLYDSPFGVPTTSKAAVFGDAAIGAAGIDQAAKGLNGSTDSKVNLGLSLLPMTGVATRGVTNMYNAAKHVSTQVPDYAAQFARTSKRLIKGFKDPKQWNPTFVGTTSRKIFGYNPDKLINFQKYYKQYNGKYDPHLSKLLDQEALEASFTLNHASRALTDSNPKLKEQALRKQIQYYEKNLIPIGQKLRNKHKQVEEYDDISRKINKLYHGINSWEFTPQSWTSSPFSGSFEKNHHKMLNPYSRKQKYSPLDLKILLQDKQLNILKANYPGLFQANQYQNPFTSGKISFPIFKTGEIKEFNIPDIKLSLRFNPNTKLLQSVVDKPLSQGPKDYQEALRLNNEYIQQIIPGWKPFGSSVLAQNGVPHATHDFDGAISWTDFQKWKNSLSPEDKPFLKEGKPGETYSFELNQKKFGDAGHIDINIINPEKLNERSYELFRQFAPDDYESANVSLASMSPKEIRRIPFVNKSGNQITDVQLMGLLDPYTKSAMDAIESRKSKHLSRAPLVMLLGDPEKNAKAIEQTAYELYGGHPYTIPESVDMGTPEDRFIALQEIGVPEWIANYAKNNPQITKNLINSYILTHKQLLRVSNTGDMHENGGSKEKLLRNYLGYQPAPEGGSYSGRGTNWILGDKKAFDNRAFVGTMQPSEDLFKITNGTNIKDTVHNILKYFNMNNNYVFQDEDLFMKYVNTPQMIGNQSIKPLGFLGDFYNSSRYFGIGPLDNKKINLRTFINRPQRFWGETINDYNVVERKNNRENPDFVPGSFEGSLPKIEFPKPWQFDQSKFTQLRDEKAFEKEMQYGDDLHNAMVEPVFKILRKGMNQEEFDNKRQSLNEDLYYLQQKFNNFSYPYQHAKQNFPIALKQIAESSNLNFKLFQNKLKIAKNQINSLNSKYKYLDKTKFHNQNLLGITNNIHQYNPFSINPIKMTGVLTSPVMIGINNWMDDARRKRLASSYEFLNKNKIKYHVSPDSPHLIVYKNENPQITNWEESDNWPSHILIFNKNK